MTNMRAGMAIFVDVDVDGNVLLMRLRGVVGLVLVPRSMLLVLGLTLGLDNSPDHSSVAVMAPELLPERLLEVLLVPLDLFLENL